MKRRTFLGAALGATAGMALGGQLGVEPSTLRRVLVATTEELQAAIRDASDGDSILIENGQYRTTEWLDIDVSNVTIRGESRDGVVIKPADAANVGGFRVGTRRKCSNILIESLSFDGNQQMMDLAAKNLYGVLCRDVEHVTIRNLRVAHTHPKWEHTTGGSGIRFGAGCRYFRAENNYIHDIGDRGIEVSDGAPGGVKFGWVTNNIFENGFDRHISLDQGAENVLIEGNMNVGSHEAGSSIGVGFSGGMPVRRIVIRENNFRKSTRNMVTVKGRVEDLLIENNVCEAPGTNLVLVNADGEESLNRRIVVRNNLCLEAGANGLYFEGYVEDWTVEGNQFIDPVYRGISIRAGSGVIRANSVRGARDRGIFVETSGVVSVVDNDVRDGDTQGILIADAAMGSDVSGNVLAGNDRNDMGQHSLVVDADGVFISGNRVLSRAGRDGKPMVISGEQCIFVDNLVPPDPWNTYLYTAFKATTLQRGNVVPVDAHTVRDEDGDRKVVVSFNRPYASPPRLTFGRTSGGIVNVDFGTNDLGEFVDATIEVRAPGGLLDVTVESA